VRALAAARETGANTALITAASNTPAHDIADVVLRAPLRDKSYCHTVGYTSPMLTGFYLASAYRQEEFPAASLAGYLRELLTMRSCALESAARWARLSGSSRREASSTFPRRESWP
jgi:DNA-binding MurR/RpiR family transcriptional regulator